jgi:hypothetical protein
VQTSWKDGLAFCALVNKHHPHALPFADALPKTPMERLTLAFEVAARFGVPALLDPEDIVELPVPEKLSMITYLGVVCKGFCK